MKATIQEFLQEKAEIIDRMKALVDKAEDEKRSMNKAEDAEYRACDKRLDELLSLIERKGRIDIFEGEQKRTFNLMERFAIGGKRTVDSEEAKGGFSCLGEIFWAMHELKTNNRQDSRLDALRVEVREQQMGTGTTGGFAIPELFKDQLLMAVQQTGIVRSRATIIPAGSPPDGKLTMPSLDQTSGGNMFGGVTLVHTGEGVTMTETTMKIREVSLEPKEISAYIVATNKLLNNWPAASAVLGNQLRAAMTAQEDYDFLRGSGVNMAQGIINSPAAIAYPRAGAGAIAFADIYGMLARLKMGGSPVWLASQTVIPQLAAMVDAGSHSVWLGGGGIASASQPAPSMLFGFPIVFCDRLPALGTKGDLMLVDLSYYLIKDGSGPFLSWSEHVYFLSNKSVVKLVWNVDGHPWLTEPLILEGTTSSTVSPFVILS